MRRRHLGYDGDRFAAYIWYVGWWSLSFGGHIDIRSPNIELHLPFCFIRFGWIRPPRLPDMMYDRTTGDTDAG